MPPRRNSSTRDPPSEDARVLQLLQSAVVAVTVLAYLPPELSRRVIVTTRGWRPRLSYMLNGSGRTDVITCYAFGKGLTQWLAIDDSLYGAYHFGREPGQLMRNFFTGDAGHGHCRARRGRADAC
jgi:hypothetical protein